MTPVDAASPMIQFKCHCGQQFSVGPDQAGGLIQCPSCGRLNDIPTLSDLKNIDEEGNYKISDLELVEEPDRLPEAYRAFTRSRTDEQGNEIDLRPSMEEVFDSGVEEIPLADDQPPAAPKYDPLTGELIEPLAVKPDPANEPVGALPVATPVLGYSPNVGYEPGDASTWSLWRVGLEMLRPVNVFVMIFLMALQALWVVAMIPISAGLFFLLPLMLVPAMVLTGYFGKVVEETGPGDQDDLPRPLGSVSFREDVWSPFVGVMGAFILTFWPVLAVRLSPIPRPIEDPIVAGLWGLGAIAFPAVLLTILTSGHMSNLRPDRVLGVIAKSGAAYWGVVFLFVSSQVMNYLPVNQAIGGVAGAMAPGKVNVNVIGLMASMVSWIGSLYLTLWACFGLGLLYRRKHDAFPWAYQKHEYHNRTRLSPGQVRAMRALRGPRTKVSVGPKAAPSRAPR